MLISRRALDRAKRARVRRRVKILAVVRMQGRRKLRRIAQEFLAIGQKPGVVLKFTRFK